MEEKLDENMSLYQEKAKCKGKSPLEFGKFKIKFMKRGTYI